ncbi:hypothetical protein Bbelb_397220 [Branchiostoma belcheri]|nr:hypothetical protein Bbelb_397220 [Branchiostoma belcheri]
MEPLETGFGHFRAQFGTVRLCPVLCPLRHGMGRAQNGTQPDCPKLCPGVLSIIVIECRFSPGTVWDTRRVSQTMPKHGLGQGIRVSRTVLSPQARFGTRAECPRPCPGMVWDKAIACPEMCSTRGTLLNKHFVYLQVDLLSMLSWIRVWTIQIRAEVVHAATSQTAVDIHVVEEPLLIEGPCYRVTCTLGTSPTRHGTAVVDSDPRHLANTIKKCTFFDFNTDQSAVLLVHTEYGTDKVGSSFLNRQAVETIREREPDIHVPVFSTVLQATQDDKQDAQQDGVELLLPKLEPGDPRTDPSPDWLTFDHRSKYPHLPSKVKSIVGHADVTSRAALNIKEDRCPEAKVILIHNDISDDTQGNNSAFQNAQEADVVFSVGNKTFDHFENQFRATPVDKQPKHFEFLPRPSKIFEHTKASYKDTKTMVVLSIGRVKSVDNLKGHDLVANATDIVAVKRNMECRMRGIIEEGCLTSHKDILQTHFRTKNLKPTLLPYGTLKELHNDMLKAHLVVIPSEDEPFDLVGLDAIAAGIPVLVSDKSGLADFMNKISREFYHSTVPMEGNKEGNVKQWARCIEQVLSHCEAEFERAARCRDKLLSSKYWEESHQQLIDSCLQMAMEAFDNGFRTGPWSGTRYRTLSRPGEFCPKHTDQRLTFYCQPCAKLICRDCTITEHRPGLNHDPQDLSDVTQKFKAELQMLVRQTQDTADTLTKTKASVDEELTSITTNCQTVKKEMLQHFAQLNAKLQNAMQELTDRLEKMEKTQKEALFTEIKVLEETSKSTEDELKFCRDVLARDNDVEILTLGQQLENRLKVLSAKKISHGGLKEQEGQVQGTPQVTVTSPVGQCARLDTIETEPQTSGKHEVGVTTIGGAGTTGGGVSLCSPLTVDVNSNNPVLSFGQEGSQQGQFNRPTDVAVSGDRLYVADAWNQRVQVFDLSRWDTGETDGRKGEGQFDLPCFVCVDEKDNIIVAEKDNSRVQVFDKNFNFQHKFGQKGRQPQNMWDPTGVSADSKGNIVLGNIGMESNVGGVQYGKKLQVFRPDGTWVSTISSEGDKLSKPHGVAVTEDGHLFVADPKDHCIRKYRYM